MNKKIRNIIILSITLLLAVVAIAIVLIKGNLFNIPASQEYEFVNPDETLAETDEGMNIDGVFDEPVYSKNTWTYLHNSNGRSMVDMAVTSYFGEKGIYFAYEVEESTPIFVNMTRSSWMNSCVEMYLVPSNVESMVDENVFEIDLLPTGDLLFKRPDAAGGWSNVTTTNDKMAYLGAKTIGGEVNTDDCKGYNLELFIPYDYLEQLGVDTEPIKDGFVYMNPCHITSYNVDGDDPKVDRFWYSFATQLGGDGWNDVDRFFEFNKYGAKLTVPNTFGETEHCTLEGKDTAVPGLETTVKVIPDKGYALTSITCNEEELIKTVNYNEDGSVTLKLTATDDGFHFEAKAEPITKGKKAVTGKVVLHNMLGDTLEGLSGSYEDESGQHKLELGADGSFEWKELKQGYYKIKLKKEGYKTTERTLCVNRDLDVVIDMQYELFDVEEGICWNTDVANDGLLTKINGRGSILTNDLFSDFYMEANFKYSEELATQNKKDDYTQQRIGFRVKFDNEKYWNIDLLRHENGDYCLQYGKIYGENSLFDWDTVHVLNAEQVARYTSEDGIKLGVLRMGSTAYLYLDDVCVAKSDLGSAQRNCKAQLGFESFVSNRKIMKMNFLIDNTNVDQVTLNSDGSAGCSVSLGGKYKVGQDVTLLIKKSNIVGAKLLSLKVNGEEMSHLAMLEGDTYKLVITENLARNLSVKAIYAVPTLTSVTIKTNDKKADGISMRLVQDGEVKASAIVNNQKAAFTNIYTGTYLAQVRIFNVWTDVSYVTILDSKEIAVDVIKLFETADNVNYTGDIEFAGKETKHYSIATDISGDAWFTMKVQVDKAQLDKVAANKGNIRLGYRMFFGGETGNYEWDNEYEVTLKYREDGKWVFEQMNTWENCELPEDMINALTKDGLYLAVHRDANTGVLTLYYGATLDELQSGKYFYQYVKNTEKQKENIKRFGAGFWSEKGSDYKASVSDLSYGTTLGEALGITDVNIGMTLLGHKQGAYNALPGNTAVRLQSVLGNYNLVTDATGKINCTLTPGIYLVCVDRYIDTEIEISSSDYQANIALEYDMFNCPTGWDTDKHNLQNVNSSTPSISMNGGTMNVITNDSYEDVSATLHVKASNSTHSAHTQGIWIRFEDGNYMIVNQEDSRLWYMDGLWEFKTVNHAIKDISMELPKEIMQKWEADGYDLTLVRNGNQLYVTADGALLGVETIPAEYADDKVEIGFFAYDSAKNASWNFDITDEAQEILYKKLDARFVTNRTVEDGTEIRLLQDGQVIAQGLVKDNEAVFEELFMGVYDVELNIFGIWTQVSRVEVLNEYPVEIDVTIPFENTECLDFDGDIDFQGTSTKHYSIATEISGDAWFTMKVQVDKAQLEAAAANKENIRLGYRLFFGGESGNYEWDNEYEVTLKYNAEGKWVAEQMNSWIGWNYELSDKMVEALTDKGLYMALHRDGTLGELTLYYGTSENDMISCETPFEYAGSAEKQKENITRFGAGFWSENGSDYKASVSELSYGATLEQALGQDEVDITLTVKGHKDGKEETLASTDVKIPGVYGDYQTDSNGNIELSVIPGTYTVRVNKYLEGKLKVSATGAQEMVLEYDRFCGPQGWEISGHDLSKVNDAAPSIGKNGGTMHVLTNDTYEDVAATLHIKESNSTNSGHTQGVWIRFEDGKYMILNQEGEGISYRNDLWGSFDMVNSDVIEVCKELSSELASKWTADGYDLTLSRKGNILYVTAEDNLLGVEVLDEKYADDKVQVGFFAFDSAQNATWNFEITSETARFTTIVANKAVEDGTRLRLLQDGNVKASGKFEDDRVSFIGLATGTYQVEMKIFNVWTKISSVEVTDNQIVDIDVTKPFEDANTIDFDGDITFEGTTTKHYSVATDISGDAWLVMKVQMDKTQLEKVAANKGNVRLGYRLFFGGESGNYLWDNEYEVTLKYNAEGKWVVEQMNSWIGWDYQLSDNMVEALTDKGLYMALHRNATTGELTLYYGASESEVISGTHSFKYAGNVEKQKQNITRFGAGFWSENGSDYKATVSSLSYGATLGDALGRDIITFSGPYDWDISSHDLSRINDATPSITKDGGTMHVLTNNIYGDVAATLHIKESNSTNSGHTQGVWIQFEDGKYMILNQEGLGLYFRDDLWGSFDMLNDKKINVCDTIPNTIADKWLADGYDLTLSRKGNQISVKAEGEILATETIDEKYADDKVQVGFFAFDSAQNATWKFKIVNQ